MMFAVQIFITFLLYQVSIQKSITQRIANGQNALSNQFPFMASIQMSSSILLPYIHICCGVGIDEYWILSTGLCVKATLKLEKFRVKMGMYFTEEEDNNVQIIKIAERFVHDDFDDSRISVLNDIGLLKLENPISQPVFVKLSQVESDLTGEVLMVGWGRTSSDDDGNIPWVLQHARVLIISKQDCENILSKIEQPQLINDTHICTHSPRNSVTACVGDTGGPLVRYVNGEAEVVGLISWALYPCGIIGAPTISTHVAKYNTWLHDTMTMKPNPFFGNNDLSTPLLVQG